MNKKNRWEIIVAIFWVFLFLGVIFCKLDDIYTVLSTVKSQIRDKKDYNFRNKEQNIILAEYPEIEDDPYAWYKLYHVISHSGGG